MAKLLMLIIKDECVVVILTKTKKMRILQKFWMMPKIYLIVKKRKQKFHQND